MTAIMQRETAALVSFDREQLDLIKTQIAPGASDGELALFTQQCSRTGLDPFSRQIYAVMREQRQQVNGQWVGVKKMTIQTSIDGFRLIAERTGKYAGQVGPFWCGPDGKWVDVWLQTEPPAAARVGVLRRDFSEPLYAVARWDSFAQKNRDGKAISQWATMPDVMLAKCAEAQALRRAFPNDLSGLYTGEEMQQADSGETAPAPAQVNPDSDPEKLAAWGDKLKKIALRLVELGLKSEAVGELKCHEWQTSIRACNAAYEALKALGQAHADAQKPQEAPAEVEAVELITDTQRKAIQAQVKRVGIMDSSERRAQFWAFVLNDTIKPTATNDLSSENAQTIIDILKAMNATEAQAMGTEFAQKVPV